MKPDVYKLETNQHATHTTKVNLLGPKTLVVDFCSDKESSIGHVCRDREYVGRVQSVRLCLDLGNLREDKFYASIVAELEYLASIGFAIHVWGSIPCTVWSVWQNLNTLKGGQAYLTRLNKRRIASLELIDKFERIASIGKKSGGRVGFEWPLGCSGWQQPRVESMLENLQLEPTRVDGCATGLAAKHGNEAGLRIRKS